MKSISVKELKISTTAFDNENFISSKYSCEGKSINPPLEISGIPKEAKTLALIIEDPDAPQGIFDHWVVWNIEPVEKIQENSVPGVQGRNSFGKVEYDGPCPPWGIHRYLFKVYALDTKLDLDEGAEKKQLLEAMQGHILTMNEVMGRYRKVF